MSKTLDRGAVEAWVAAYERAWRTAGTLGLGDLFEEGATYRMSPYEEPVAGLAAIAGLWERERESHEEEFEIGREVVAVDGATAVVRLHVRYGDGTEYRDLWVLRFGKGGRCAAFEEWPYWPGQPLSAR